jgi:hypothetical protein
LSSQVLSAQVTARPDLEAWIRFLRAHSATTRALSARLEAEHGLTLNDYDVLVQLYYAPDHRMRRIDLARTVLLTASGITRLLDGLERTGWVTPLILSSPEPSTRSPSSRSRLVARKAISGYRAASKKSGV